MIKIEAAARLTSPTANQKQKQLEVLKEQLRNTPEANEAQRKRIKQAIRKVKEEIKFYQQQSE